MSCFVRAAALVLVLAIDANARAQAPVSKGVAEGLASQSVYAFQGLERNLEDALAKGDERMLKGLVSQSFQFQSAQRGLPVDPSMKPVSPRQPARILDLTVREFPSIAVVAFTLDFRTTKDVAEPVYSIVDIWSSKTHRLEWRRADELKERPPFERKPTGAE